MDRRRVFRNAFLWNALVSALMAGAALYARSGARGWLAAGWCIGVAASAAALACFCKASNREGTDTEPEKFVVCLSLFI